MDLGFRRIGRGRPADRAAIDQQRLVAALSARQAASPAARAMRGTDTAPGRADSERSALVAVYAAEPGWREATAALRHAFCRHYPQPFVNQADRHLYLGVSTFLQASPLSGCTGANAAFRFRGFA